MCSVPPSRPVVLVVEAEPLLALQAVDTLEDAGFDTELVRGVEQAISVLERRTDIRVVFTDIDMPRRLDGMKLAACIRDRWPPIEIILTSAHLAPAPSDMPDRSVFVSKPYSSERLIELARRLTP